MNLDMVFSVIYLLCLSISVLTIRTVNYAVISDWFMC